MLISFFGKYPETDQEIYYYPLLAKYYLHFYIFSSITIVVLVIYWVIQTTRQKIKPIFRLLRFLFTAIFVLIFGLGSFIFPIFTSTYTQIDVETYAGNIYYLAMRRKEFDSLRYVYLGKCSPIKQTCEFTDIKLNYLYYRPPVFLLDVSDNHLTISDVMVTIYTLDANNNLCSGIDETECIVIFEE